MSQLRLHLAQTLSYSRAGFVAHQGVADIFAACRFSPNETSFKLFTITGPARTGKTHFSVALTEELSANGFYPHLIIGSELEEWARSHRFGEDLSSAEPLIIDDLQQYFEQIKPGQSGPFVSLVENLRVRKVPLVLVSAKPFDQFAFDDHIGSRVRAGVAFRLSEPAEVDLPLLITNMARQRGLMLNDRKLQFLLKRVRRDIPSIEEYLEKVQYLADVLGKPVRFPVLGDAL